MSQAKHRRDRPSEVKVQPLKLWNESRSEEEVRIEIIPLIDVIFCILTFFILAAVGFSRQQAISLDLPQASTGAPQMREMMIVSLDDFGQVYVEQQMMSSRSQLYQAVENYFLTRPDGLMVLYASREARYDDVIQVLDILKEVGGDRVALATLPQGAEDPLDPEPIDPNEFDLDLPQAPGELDSEEIDPGDADAGDIDPGDVDTGDVDAGEETTPRNQDTDRDSLAPEVDTEGNGASESVETEENGTSQQEVEVDTQEE